MAHIPISPRPSQLAERLLDVFKKLHPTTFMIIDATVLKCNIDSSLSAQSQLYSSYKTHNVTTLKCIIRMTPDGGAVLTSKSSEIQIIILYYLRDPPVTTSSQSEATT